MSGRMHQPLTSAGTLMARSVRVVEPADGGRATEAALRAVAAAFDMPRRSVTLLMGPKNRRKLLEIRASSVDARRIQKALDQLRSDSD